MIILGKRRIKSFVTTLYNKDTMDEVLVLSYRVFIGENTDGNFKRLVNSMDIREELKTRIFLANPGQLRIVKDIGWFFNTDAAAIVFPKIGASTYFATYHEMWSGNTLESCTALTAHQRQEVMSKYRELGEKFGVTDVPERDLELCMLTAMLCRLSDYLNSRISNQ